MGVNARMGYVWVDDDDNDDDDTSSTGKAPADLPEPARKHLRKVEAEKKNLEKQLAELQASARKNTLSDFVKAKGYDPKVASFVPSDVSGDEAVEKWLDENASLFVKAGSTATESGQDQSSNVSPETMAQLAKLSKVTNEGLSPQGAETLAALIKGANNPKELDDVIAAAIKAGRP